ncbi:endothelial cell-specific chemotaxis regulator isoform X2 [Talpa occidentalis]|uniref:endothelial cell-specific chemotaxis regulator isoform X2 n=1 Tax=Talpa occidentalis TaxID=50954 RepID=UPI001890A4AD|nr:endothelial cell-specific chemotaxis regulator isoform X2 [Talpa occidentalis]
MGIFGAMQLCWMILCFLLLQGYNSQPTTAQPSGPQGTFSSLSLTTEPTSPNTAAPEASRTPVLASESTTSRSSTMDSHASSLLDLTQPEPQKHTSGLGTGVPSSNSSSGSTSEDTSQNVTPKSATMSLRTREDLTILPSPTSETVLTVAAFGVISFIVILVVVVIVLVSVVSLRFKCRKNKESEDPQKPGSSGISESCSTANGEKDSITLISMKNINMNNSKGCSSAEKVL